jgi:carbonic anhydrase
MTYKVDMKKKKAEALVVHCADPRFQQAYRELIDSFGVYHDLVVMPGASKAIVDDQKIMLEKIKLLHDFHKFETVYLLDHIDCGAYGVLAEEHAAHAQHLKKASDLINSVLPEVKVEMYILSPDKAQVIT